MPKPIKDQEEMSIGKFSLGSLRDNSKVTIIGRETNPQLIYKQYRNYFKDLKQVKEILEFLPKGDFLVIDETSPNNKIENIIFHFKPE